MDLIRRVAGDTKGAGGADQAAPDLDAVYRRVYKNFVEHIDGIDNGIESFDSGERNYEVSTTLSSRVGQLNPAWNEPNSPEETNARFAKAVALTSSELVGQVQGCLRSWWPARSLVKAALDAASDIHPSRQILMMPSYCPWTTHLFQLEKESGATVDDNAAGIAK